MKLDAAEVFAWLDEEDAYISCLFWEKFCGDEPRPEGYSEMWSKRSSQKGAVSTGGPTTLAQIDDLIKENWR